MEKTEKKLHVDEDWKSQVEREKEAAKAQSGGAPSASAAQQSAAESPSATTEESTRRHAAETAGRFGVSAPGDQALEALGITPEAVAAAARSQVGSASTRR